MQGFQLDHSLFRDKLNANFLWSGPNHCCPTHAFTWLEGVYFSFYSLGLKKRQIDRIILEHLEPGYYVERMLPGRVSPAAPFDGDPFILITLYYKDREYPFDRETDMVLQRIYFDPAHSIKFFEKFFEGWLPAHRKLIEQREKSRGFFKKILADNPTCFSLREIIPDT